MARLLALATAGLLVSTLTGCAGKYTGGGYIDSVTGAPRTATFGFNINGTDVDGDGSPDVAKGQFQYNDHAAGVSFHVDIDTREDGVYCNPDCFAPDPVISIPYSGTYKSKAGGGRLKLGVTSANDGLGNRVDTLWIYEVSTGPYAGYSNYGVVQRGNIQFHPQK
ncbi:MAG: hypothetical protein MUP13_05145 [Thermoanaerobaculales bacterium]|nr:hypothetical protein [Thermoanaerobaculales bacterium]